MNSMVPLPDCSIGNYHLYSLWDSLYLLYPNTIDYCGASTYSHCSSYLIKPYYLASEFESYKK